MLFYFQFPFGGKDASELELLFFRQKQRAWVGNENAFHVYGSNDLRVALYNESTRYRGGRRRHFV